ncbi:hypothetical protein Tco_0453228 [Tanacetum coccineum]
MSFHHVIKLDVTLGNLKFANKGTKDPVFRMAIPAVMLNDDIKASAKYSEYLANFKGYKPIKATGKGKGFLSKQGVEIDIERVNIPKRRSKTVIEETGQSKDVADEVDSEATNEEDEIPLIQRRHTGVGSGVTLAVLDEPKDSDSSSTLASEYEIEDISSDEADNTKKADIKKDSEE